MLLRNRKALCPADFPRLENLKKQIYFLLLQSVETLETPHRTLQHVTNLNTVIKFIYLLRPLYKLVQWKYR